MQHAVLKVHVALGVCNVNLVILSARIQNASSARTVVSPKSPKSLSHERLARLLFA